MGMGEVIERCEGLARGESLHFLCPSAGFSVVLNG